MGRLQTWGAAGAPLPPGPGDGGRRGRGPGGRRHRAGDPQRPPAPTTAPSPALSTRAVALGDSVPYGHGLANPYPTPQIGLPADALSQGPSTEAYPTLVARHLRLTMTVRPTNCHLTGDQLAISGAVADGSDNTSRDGQCPVPPRQARNLTDELAATGLVQHPARLVLLQDGADDIDFSACLEYQLARRPRDRHRTRQLLRGRRLRHSEDRGGPGQRPHGPGPGH